MIGAKAAVSQELPAKEIPIIIPNNFYVVTDRPEHFIAFGWHQFMDIWEALSRLDNFQTYLELDTETTGLKCFLQEKLNAIQLGNDAGVFIFDIQGLENGAKPLKSLIESKLCYLHNAAYDLPILYHYGIVPKEVYDTLVAEYELTRGLLKNVRRRLQDLTQKYLGINIDKSQQTVIADGLNSIEAVVYSGTDVLHLKAIAEKQIEKAKKMEVYERVKFENKFVRMLAYMEWCGVGVNMPLLQEHVREVEWREWSAAKKMEQYGTINWNSSKQVIEVLEKHGIREINPKTKNATKDTDSLKKHPDKQIAVDLIEYSEAAKESTSFGRRWLHFVQSDKRIHTRYKQFTAAGRTSCGSLMGKKGEDAAKKFNPFNIHYKETRPFPNLQQLPRKGLLRKCLVPTKKGDKFVISDYSSQESVILAEMSQDPAMLAFFETGTGDLHSYTARLVYPHLKELTDKQIKDDYEELRYKVKSGNFAIAYLGDAHTISQNLNIPLDQAQEIYDGIMGVFTRLPEYFKECYAFTELYGYIPIDPIGGKRFFDRSKEFRALAGNRTYWNRYYREREDQTAWYKDEARKNEWFFTLRKQLRKESVNSRIQGHGAFMSKLAGIYILDYIEKNNLWGKVKVPLFVHDEWVCEQSEALTPTMTKVVKDLMELAGTRTLKRLKIKAEPKVADLWAK